MRFLTSFTVFVLMISCGPARNTNPCNMDATLVKGKRMDHPDKEAFHLDVVVLEKDGSPAEGRMVHLSMNEPWVSRTESGGIYSSIRVTYSGIAKQWILGKGGAFNLDVMQSESIEISIKPFNDIKIRTPKGKTQKIFIYLDDITMKDCYAYIDQRKSQE